MACPERTLASVVEIVVLEEFDVPNWAS